MTIFSYLSALCKFEQFNAYFLEPCGHKNALSYERAMNSSFKLKNNSTKERALNIQKAATAIAGATILSLGGASLALADAPAAQNSQQAGISQGQSGQLSKQEIMQVQKKLNAKGYDVSTTGQLDQDTRDALRQFQQAHNLTVTGSPDAETLEALGVQA